MLLNKPNFNTSDPATKCPVDEQRGKKLDKASERAPLQRCAFQLSNRPCQNFFRSEDTQTIVN